MKKIVFSLIFIFIQTAGAGNLSAPFDLESTSVLPKGVNNPRLRGVWISLGEVYNGSGQIESLGGKLNKSVTWDQVVKAQDTSLQPLARASVNSVCTAGVNCEALGEGPGETTGAVNVDMSITVPTYVRGITDNTSFILAIPVYSVDVRANTGFVPSQAYYRWLQTFSGDPYQLNSVQSNFVDPINKKAADAGYKLVEAKSFRSLGDVKIGGKTKWDNILPHTNMAVKYLATLPTGTPPNADYLVDVATGDGGYALGLTGVAEYSFLESLSFVSVLGYNYQIEDKLTRRIPTASGDPVSSDKEEVTRKRGNQYLAGVGLNVGKASKGLSFGVGYNYQIMEQTNYTGSKFSSERYGYLNELAPSQNMQSMTLTAAYSTIDAYRNKLFLLPMNLSLSYAQVLAGVNVPKSDFLSSELVLFF